jgi:hypothetical protein
MLARLTPRGALPINRACSRKPRPQGCDIPIAGECPERQRGRTVNPLAYAFVGSSPTSPTTLKSLVNPSLWPHRLRPFSCRVCCKFFPSVFNDCQSLPAAPCNMTATCGAPTAEFAVAGFGFRQNGCGLTAESAMAGLNFGRNGCGLCHTFPQNGLIRGAPHKAERPRARQKSVDTPLWITCKRPISGAIPRSL